MAHEEVNTLLNALLPFAQQMLGKYGEFLPFAAAIDNSGEVQMVGTHDGDEHPSAQQLIDQFTEVFRTQAKTKSIRAAGICYDGRVVPPNQTEKSDAICCILEHGSGETIQLYLPYQNNVNKQIQYGEIFAAALEPRFFIG
ncbi:MAG TPA: hypothetical protein VG714_04900 [Acidobacteriaceae bacterium]|nr:hypothetical protein [Acidobacteriaceae bacterium]